MASQRNGTLYICVTSNLQRRVEEHKLGINESFTKEYGAHLLVYFEPFSDINEAIVREKRLKKWNRKWKLNLIEKVNPEWVDLSTVGFRFPELSSVGPGFPPSRE